MARPRRAPSAFTHLPISAVGEVTTGSTPPTAKRDCFGGSIPFVTPADLDAEEPLTSARQSLTEKGAAASRVAPPGAVLVSCIGSLGKVGYAGRAVAYNQQINAVRFDPRRVDSRFGYHALRALRPILEATASGTTLSIVSKSRFEALPIPVPPLPEQRRIAAILDKASAVLFERRRSVARAEELLPAIFLAMFGDPAMEPARWPVRAIGDIVERFEAGWSAPGEPRRRALGERGVLKVSAVSSGFFRSEEHKAVMGFDERAGAGADARRSARLITPRRGDLLLSRANTRELIAATCLVEEDEPALFLPDKLWRVVPRAGHATPEHLRYLLGHPRVRGAIAALATGTSGSMLNVTMDDVRRARVPVPPIAEQERFAALVWSAYGLRRRLLDALRGAERLSEALAERGLRGEL
jgi:type I restriction enzyme S subunit